MNQTNVALELGDVTLVLCIAGPGLVEIRQRRPAHTDLGTGQEYKGFDAVLGTITEQQLAAAILAAVNPPKVSPIPKTGWTVGMLRETLRFLPAESVVKTEEKRPGGIYYHTVKDIRHRPIYNIGGEVLHRELVLDITVREGEGWRDHEL